MNTSKARILIVDDCPENLFLLEEVLASRYSVRGATSGQEALDLAVCSPQPDLILLDVMMPGLDGYAVLGRLRQDSRTSGIPVIFITAQDTEGSEERGFELGAVDYITKPFRTSVVLARVRTHVELKRARDRLLDQGAVLEAEVARRTAELARLKDQAEAESRAKSQFISNLSQELRTPVNSLLLLSQLLVDNTESHLSQDQLKLIGVIHEAGSDLLAVIENVLDLAKIEAGRAIIAGREVRFEEVFGALERKFSDLARNKGLDFGVHLDPGLPAWIHTDPVHLLPILRNLVANAIKFTTAGEVRVEVRPASLGRGAGGGGEADEGMIAIDVTDTGIGIPAEQLPRIFSAFAPTLNGTTGTAVAGLGLYIANANARLLGGQLRAISTFGQGSTFSLFLPARYLDQA